MADNDHTTQGLLFGEPDQPREDEARIETTGAPMVSGGRKRCKKCKEVKSHGEFRYIPFKQIRHKDGYLENRRSHWHPRCRTCESLDKKQWIKRRESAEPGYYKRYFRYWKISKKYAISEAEYNEMLASQKGLCLICGQAETKLDRTGCASPLSIDHCHVCNKVRGLLCRACNVILGMCKEDPDVLNRLINFIDCHKSECLG